MDEIDNCIVIRKFLSSLDHMVQFTRIRHGNIGEAPIQDEELITVWRENVWLN